MLLWTIALGMLALALWQAGEVLLWWHGLFDPAHRMHVALVCAKCLAKGAVYAVLEVTALLFAVGLEYEADERLRDLTDETLDIPGGAVLVGGVRGRSIAVGLYTLVESITDRFMKDIDLPAAPDPLGASLIEASAGSVRGQGIAFALVGALLWQAATSADVSTATGLDGALAAIAEVGAGPRLLTAVRVGFAAFGLYALARARYPDRDRRPESRPSGRRRRR